MPLAISARLLQSAMPLMRGAPMQSLQTNVERLRVIPDKVPRVSAESGRLAGGFSSCEIGDRLEDNRVSHLNNPLQKCYATGNDAKGPSGRLFTRWRNNRSG